jgi:hypothetical protein
MKKISAMFLSLFTAMLAMAQDAGIDINVNEKSSGGFWGSPWMWIIGAAVFIFFIVALI